MKSKTLKEIPRILVIIPALLLIIFYSKSSNAFTLKESTYVAARQMCNHLSRGGEAVFYEAYNALSRKDPSTIATILMRMADCSDQFKKYFFEKTIKNSQEQAQRLAELLDPPTAMTVLIEPVSSNSDKSYDSETKKTIREIIPPATVANIITYGLESPDVNGYPNYLRPLRRLLLQLRESGHSKFVSFMEALATFANLDDAHANFIVYFLLKDIKSQTDRHNYLSAIFSVSQYNGGKLLSAYRKEYLRIRGYEPEADISFYEKCPEEVDRHVSQECLDLVESNINKIIRDIPDKNLQEDARFFANQILSGNVHSQEVNTTESRCDGIDLVNNAITLKQNLDELKLITLGNRFFDCLAPLFPAGPFDEFVETYNARIIAEEDERLSQIIHGVQHASTG